jgi:hypothetical protein
MAEPSGSGSMGFILGAIVVVLLVVGGLVYFGAGDFGRPRSVDVNVSAPSVPTPDVPSAPSPGR